MKSIHLIVLASSFFLLCACTMFDTRQSVPDTDSLQSKTLVLPIGESWQIVEEAPNLSDERGRLPFQSEQSVQPEGVKPVLPAGTQKIETLR